MEKRRPTVLIGIDPSFVNFGVCLYWPEKKKMLLHMAEMMHAVRWISTTLKAEGLTIRDTLAFVEDPNLNNAVFGMWAMVEREMVAYVIYEKWIARGRNGKPPRRVVKADVESVFRRAMKRAQDLGKNKESATQIMKMLHEQGVHYIQVAPSERDKAYREEFIKGDDGKKKKTIVRQQAKALRFPTKTTQAQFTELTGHKGSTSEHARDAATLVYGRTITNAIYLATVDAAKRGRRPPSYPAPHNSNEYLFSRNKEAE
jgi:hypothetical protein